MLALVVASAASIRRTGLSFLTSTRWDPVHQRFGALPFLYGTVVSSLLALCLAVPVSVGLAIFLSDLAPHRLRRPLGFLVELLAAIPSVVYGFWGISVLVPFLRERGRARSWAGTSASSPSSAASRWGSACWRRASSWRS